MVTVMQKSMEIERIIRDRFNLRISNMNSYIILYIGKRHELKARDPLDAFERGVNYFKVPKGRRHLVSVSAKEES